jgi:hypothetical protein
LPGICGEKILDDLRRDAAREGFGKLASAEEEGVGPDECGA